MGHRRTSNLNLGLRARDDVLGLVAAGLDDQAILVGSVNVDTLPSLSTLGHVEDISALSAGGSLLLAHQPHRQVAHIDAVILVLLLQESSSHLLLVRKVASSEPAAA